jgi:hypothetical protein
MMIAKPPARSATRSPSSGTDRPCRRHGARRGISLIELLVVMSSVSIVLGLCAVTIQLLFRLNADGHARLSASASFARLATQFREDIHACDDVAILPAAKGVTKPGDPKAVANLRLTDGAQMVITYEARDGRVARVAPAAGKMSGHESYVVGKGNVVTFEHRDEGSLRFVVMIMSRQVGKGQIEPPRPIEVLALQGKDRPSISKPKGDRPR